MPKKIQVFSQRLPLPPLFFTKKFPSFLFMGQDSFTSRTAHVPALSFWWWWFWFWSQCRHLIFYKEHEQAYSTQHMCLHQRHNWPGFWFCFLSYGTWQSKNIGSFPHLLVLQNIYSSFTKYKVGMEIPRVIKIVVHNHPSQGAEIYKWWLPIRATGVGAKLCHCYA